MELKRIWEVIRRRKWVILQALIVVTLVAVIGSYLVTPSYEASSKILIKTAKKGGIDFGSMGLGGLASVVSTTTDVDINKVLAASRPYIDEMVFKLQIRDDQGNLIKAADLAGLGMVSTMRGRIFPKPSIWISQYQATDILQIKATSPDPEEAMMMANTLAEIMIDQNKTQMRAEYRSARVFLEGQIKKVKERYSTALLALTDFKKQEGTVDLKIETKVAVDKMSDLMKEKEDNIIDLAEAHAKLNRLKKQLAKISSAFLSAVALQENPHIEILKEKLTGLRLELTEASVELTEQHPQVMSLREQIRATGAELKKEIDVFRSTAPDLMNLQRGIAALEAHLKGVNKDIDKYSKLLERFPDKALKEASLDMDLELSQRAYSSLLDSLHQAGVGEATTLSEIRVVESAVKPFSPMTPNKALNSVLGLFLGLVFGFALALITEYMDDTIKTGEDMKEFEPVALIGTVPKFEGREVTLISTRDPNDPLYESYRKIRNQLATGEISIGSLLITSAGPQEGKTMTVANLGISVAREGKKAVVVDMDFRRAGLHTFFHLPNDVGMADLLQGKISLDEAVQTTRIDGLSMISSGLPFSDPGRLIESDEMGRVMSELTTRFDLVVLDSAPALVKSDALFLARYVDGSVIVLESEKTTRKALHALMDILAKADIRPIGFVLNSLPVRRGKHFYHQYYYGNYGPELSTNESG